MDRDVGFVVSEALHQAAFGNKTVGRSQFPTPHTLHTFDGPTLRVRLRLRLRFCAGDVTFVLRARILRRCVVLRLRCVLWVLRILSRGGFGGRVRFSLRAFVCVFAPPVCVLRMCLRLYACVRTRQSGEG